MQIRLFHLRLQFSFWNPTPQPGASPLQRILQLPSNQVMLLRCLLDLALKFGFLIELILEKVKGIIGFFATVSGNLSPYAIPPLRVASLKDCSFRENPAMILPKKI